MKISIAMQVGRAHCVKVCSEYHALAALTIAEPVTELRQVRIWFGSVVYVWYEDGATEGGRGGLRTDKLYGRSASWPSSWPKPPIPATQANKSNDAKAETHRLPAIVTPAAAVEHRWPVSVDSAARCCR